MHVFGSICAAPEGSAIAGKPSHCTALHGTGLEGVIVECGDAQFLGASIFFVWSVYS